MGLSPGEYWIVLALAVAGTVAGFYFGWRNWRRARLIEDAPTAKIRSAHQGFVELEGQGRLMDGEPIIAPLTNHPCLWYRYQIERQDTYHTKNGTQTKWVTIKQKSSDELFHLDDDTGLCVIDPDGAEITTDEKLVWYGDNQWPTSAPLLGSGSKLIGMGRYRYSEWLILAGNPCTLSASSKPFHPASSILWQKIPATSSEIGNRIRPICWSALMSTRMARLIRMSGRLCSTRPNSRRSRNFANGPSSPIST